MDNDNDIYDEKYDEDYSDAIVHDDADQMLPPRFTQDSQWNHNSFAPTGGTYTTGPEEDGKKSRKNLTPEETFAKAVNFNYYKYDLDRGVANQAINLAPVISRIKFRSPLGIMFGLMAIDAGNNKEKLNRVFKKGIEVGLRNFDIIRYKKFIVEHKLIEKITR